MKFIHAADIHLDSPMRGLETYDGAPVEEMRQSTRRAFDNLVRLCLDENADFLLIAGDLYDGDWTDFNTGLYLVKQMALLKAQGIRVFILRGNHDAQSQITRSLPLPDNVLTFGTNACQTHVLDDLGNQGNRGNLGVAVHGQSFASAHITDNLARDYLLPHPGLFNIGMLHTALEGHPDHGTYAPCSLNDLLSKEYDYWALGHVHQHTVLHESPHVVFPGNLQGRHIKEEGAKGACVVEVTDGKVRSLRHHPLDVLRWLHLELPVGGLKLPIGGTGHSTHYLEDVTRAARQPLEAALAEGEHRLLAVRLSLTGKTPLHGDLLGREEELTNHLRALSLELDGDLYVEKVRVRTTSTGASAKTTAPPSASETGEESPEALEALTQMMGDIIKDPEAREQLLAEVRPLLDKLPATLQARNPELTLKLPDDLTAFLEDARALALSRISGKESPEEGAP